MFLESTIDVLDLEQESYDTSKLFTWVFYLIFIILTFFQVVSFRLYNGIFHPFSKILDGTDDNLEQGKGQFTITCLTTNTNILNCNTFFDISECPSTDL